MSRATETKERNQGKSETINKVGSVTQGPHGLKEGIHAMSWESIRSVFTGTYQMASLMLCISPYCLFDPDVSVLSTWSGESGGRMLQRKQHNQGGRKLGRDKRRDDD